MRKGKAERNYKIMKLGKFVFTTKQQFIAVIVCCIIILFVTINNE